MRQINVQDLYRVRPETVLIKDLHGDCSEVNIHSIGIYLKHSDRMENLARQIKSISAIISRPVKG